jgi:hypothetical protein
MPFFKTTHNIFIDGGEYFDPNWMDSDTLVLPPSTSWTYEREMRIEDVNLWELIVEGGHVGVYAAWDPYAEFYLIKPPYNLRHLGFETYYGKGALKQVKKRLEELRIPVNFTKYWVEPENMWLYE